MSIFDNFRKISGAEIYRECCDTIKQYHLYYQVEAVVPTENPEEQEKRHKMKRKSFYMSGFSNQDWFLQFKYCPIDGKFIPIMIRICRKVDIRITEDGIKCNPDSLVNFEYNKSYSLSEWNEAKSCLIKALDYALDTPNRIEASWGDWLAGEEDKSLIHYEQAKKPLKINIKKGPKTAGGKTNA